MPAPGAGRDLKVLLDAHPGQHPAPFGDQDEPAPHAVVRGEPRDLRIVEAHVAAARRQDAGQRHQ